MKIREGKNLLGSSEKMIGKLRKLEALERIRGRKS